MIDEIKRQVTSFKILTALLIIAVATYLIQIYWGFFSGFSDVFVIMLSAWLLSFALEPLVVLLSNWARMPRVVASLVVYIFFLGLISVTLFIFFPLVYKQVQQLLVILPKYLLHAPPFLQRWIDLFAQSLGDSLSIISSFAAIVFDIFLVIIISFYLVVDKAKIAAEIDNITPKSWKTHVH